MNTDLLKQTKRYLIVHACFQVAKPSDNQSDDNKTICPGTYQWLSILGLLVWMLLGRLHWMVPVLVKEH